MPDFARKLIRWQRLQGRHDLPWQPLRDPYRIWLSEVMLQQTRVETVLPYFKRFLARFPDVRALAASPVGEVLRLWSGLGYYARARNLHAAARRIVRLHGGRFPRDAGALEQLPGLGRSSAAAIAVFAFGARRAILDGNARRVLARCFGIAGFPGQSAVTRELWSLADSLLPERSMRGYTQGLMDLGATVCLRAKPRCSACPVAAQCVALREQRVDEIPAARPRKKLPQREVRWLLLVQRGQVLLERRPAHGLWGGLWVFPQLDGRDARSAVRALGCEVERIRSLPVLEHGFTHFRLKVQPLLCTVARTRQERRQSGRRWADIGQAARDAVPVPVRKLLRDLAMPVTGT
ncbi:MAG: A/G-specific adenine glycosylase [Burkholderiales bacterium]